MMRGRVVGGGVALQSSEGGMEGDALWRRLIALCRDAADLVSDHREDSIIASGEGGRGSDNGARLEQGLAIHVLVERHVLKKEKSR